MAHRFSTSSSLFFFFSFFFLFFFYLDTHSTASSHLHISTTLICPPFLPEPNVGACAQEILSALWQLDGKKENLWPWKMKMMLPWELLILLSLKGCLAGEMPRQVPFHDTPDMHTPLTGRLSHASLGYGFYLKGHDHGLRRDHEFRSFCIWYLGKIHDQFVKNVQSMAKAVDLIWF